MTTPNPKTLFGQRKQAPVAAPAPEYPPAPPAPRLAAVVDLDAPLHGTVRPGVKNQVVTEKHDGVVKSKALLRGQRVRPFVHGEPRGAERVVDEVKVLRNGEVRITWLSPHSPEVRKAAYRWFDASWVGQDTDRIVQVPALVPVR